MVPVPAGRHFSNCFRPGSGPPPVRTILWRKKANSLVPAIVFSPLHGPFRKREGLVLVYVFRCPSQNDFTHFFLDGCSGYFFFAQERGRGSPRRQEGGGGGQEGGGVSQERVARCLEGVCEEFAGGGGEGALNFFFSGPNFRPSP